MTPIGRLHIAFRAAGRGWRLYTRSRLEEFSGKKSLNRSGFYFWSGIVRGLSLESTTKTANRLAGSLSLAFSLIL